MAFIRYTSIFLLTFVTSRVLTQCTLEDAKSSISDSIQQFSIDIAKRIAVEKEYHFVTSTFSVWTLLSILSLGATNQTLAELQQTLRLPTDECVKGKLFEIIQTATISTDNQTVLERSSSLYTDNLDHFKESYKKKLLDSKISEIRNISFVDSVKAAAEINKYVEDCTHGVINNFVQPSDLLQVYMVLIDALYFKGPWERPFSNVITRKKSFHDESGKEIGEVNLMVADFFGTNIGQVTEIGATVLELPYGHSKRYSMLLFLPDEGKTVAGVLYNLKTIKMKTILEKLIAHKVQYEIPRFEIESDLKKLKNILIESGLKRMFESEAQFGEMTNSPVKVDEFIQRAHVKVAENGTEAAAATAALFFRSSSLYFKADKPFLFMIIDRDHAIALFTGAYSKPSLQ